MPLAALPSLMLCEFLHCEFFLQKDKKSCQKSYRLVPLFTCFPAQDPRAAQVCIVPVTGPATAVADL